MTTDVALIVILVAAFVAAMFLAAAEDVPRVSLSGTTKQQTTGTPCSGGGPFASGAAVAVGIVSIFTSTLRDGRLWSRHGPQVGSSGRRKVSMRKFLIVAVAAGLLVGLVATPVSAAKPEVVLELEFEDSYPWSDLIGDPIACKDGERYFGTEPEPDFYVVHQISGKLVEKQFLIKGGEVLRHQGSIRGTDYLINSEETSKMITGKFHTKAMFNTAPGEEAPTDVITSVGPDWHMVAPGFGAVFVTAGRLVLDFSLPGEPFVSFSGRDDWGNFEYDAVCEALS
jgi:hypothetical protein